MTKDKELVELHKTILRAARAVKQDRTEEAMELLSLSLQQLMVLAVYQRAEPTKPVEAAVG